jgi:glycosyltransferase involved in cell wall biosynthesis
LRIALVTGMFPVPHDQTRGRYIYETAAALAKLADVHVLFQQFRYPDLGVLRPRSGLYARVIQNYSVPGLDVQTLEYPAIQGLTRPVNGWTSSRFLYPRIKRIDPDVVLAYWLYPDGFAALLAARRLGIPAVVGALGSDVHVPGALNAWFARKVAAEARALLAVSRDMRETLIRDYGARPEDTHAIVNGINSQNFFPRDRGECRRELGISPGQRLILYVGRLYRAKGLIELLDAFETLRADDPQIHLAIVGDGVMKEELQQQIGARQLQRGVRLLGGLEPRQVAVWLGAADLMCLPSWSEGYPNVVVEAVCCGRPVVATDVGGTREIVNERNGVLVRPKDPLALSAALKLVLDRKWDAAQIAASIHRTWDDVGRETYEVLRQAAASRRSARAAT